MSEDGTELPFKGELDFLHSLAKRTRINRAGHEPSWVAITKDTPLYLKCAVGGSPPDWLGILGTDVCFGGAEYIKVRASLCFCVFTKDASKAMGLEHKGKKYLIVLPAKLIGFCTDYLVNPLPGGAFSIQSPPMQKKNLFGYRDITTCTDKWSSGYSYHYQWPSVSFVVGK